MPDGISHVIGTCLFYCINTCQIPREMFEHSSYHVWLLVLLILPYSNQIRPENAAKTLKKKLSYTGFSEQNGVSCKNSTWISWLNMEFHSFDNGLKQQQGGMQNGDKASPSIISATLEQHCMFCILIHFNIVYYQRRSFKCQPMY